jgi:hypothetical protein
VLVGYEPETDAGHALLMQALKRLSKPVAKKHPLTARMLRGMFSLLDMSQSGHPLVWGLLLIGYFFLLRRGEFLMVDGKWVKYVLLFGDAQFYDGNERPCKAQHATMVGIDLRGGKNNHFGRNEIRYQFATGDPILCPVRTTSLLNSGANPLVIKLLGRWLSDCYQSYPVLTSKGTVGVSKLMC